MKKIHVYFRTRPPKSRYLPGDRRLVHAIRRLVKGEKVSGVKKVFINLCKGFDLLQVDYDINLSFNKIAPGEPVVVLGDGTYALEGYQQPNPVIAGIGLMTHPAEWPDLMQQYPVAKYLQHSAWANDIYIPFYGEANCALWPAGIDTGHWKPDERINKTFDVLIYKKFLWNKTHTDEEIAQPIIERLNSLGLSYREITYGTYTEPIYMSLLKQCKAMIFLCEHESQGFACCEAMAMNVPVYAWDQGYWLDPNRFKWRTPVVKATSTPFFDECCGKKFTDIADFKEHFNMFWASENKNEFAPRRYILENLTLEKSALAMLNIISSVYTNESE